MEIVITEKLKYNIGDIFGLNGNGAAKRITKICIDIESGMVFYYSLGEKIDEQIFNII